MRARAKNKDKRACEEAGYSQAARKITRRNKDAIHKLPTAKPVDNMGIARARVNTHKQLELQT